MKDIEIQKLSYRQLLDLKKRIETAIAHRQTDERAVVKKKIEDMAKRAGFLVSDLFGDSREQSRTTDTAVKYRHPKDRALFWTGRGRRPKWIIQEGGDIERFRVA